MSTSPATRSPSVGLSVLLGTVLLALPAAAWAADGEAGSESLEQMGSGILQRVEDIRGLSTLERVPIRTVDPTASAREHLEAIRPADLRVLRDDETLLRRIGFLPPGFDLLEAMEDLAGQGVAGYYRPEEGDIAIVDGDGTLDAYAPWTIAHEYVHALQDQHFDIQAVLDAAPRGDAQTAIGALIEGDATLLMMALAMRDALSGSAPPDPGEQAALETGASDLEVYPPALARELIFPYLDGLYFAQRLWGRGGWSAVDTAWAGPPVSTEQVMHPERYPEELPLAVRLPDLAERLGRGWTTGPRSTMGELRLSILAAGDAPHEIPLLPLTGIRLPNAEAADGWAGDRIATVEGPRGAWAVVWQTAWDSPADAAEFASAARAAMPGWAEVQSVHEGVSVDPGVADEEAVLLLVADRPATLRAVERELGLR
jgi:hypothetical protein